MNCAEIEGLLCEYVEGSLPAAQRSEVERHLAQCPTCAELASASAVALAFVESAADVEPPPELMTRILFEGPWNKGRQKSGAWRKWFSGALSPILQPRFVMGMAMTILSFSMLFRVVSPSSLSSRDWRPAAMWATLETRANYAWGRTVKFYENLKFVYEIQSALRNWQQQQQEEQRPVAGNKSGESPDGRKLPVTTVPEQGDNSGVTPQ
jgi:hypothetical protein